MSTKRARAMQAYGGHTGSATVTHIESNVQAAYPEAYRELTGRQYGKVMAVANQSYHDGKAAAGAELDSELVMAGGRAWPVPLLEKLTYSYQRVTTYVPAGEPGGFLAERGGDNDYYRKDGDNYVKVERHEAEYLLRNKHAPIYWCNRDTHTIVRFEGVEIARYPYAL